ncbi:uncharacterized protein PgNI_04448 [Pyricularia grisea]|uniref:Uncharacterized protein n=1 Tax=Pyricularia grisea TaxID=148305 RepID=A0A6P8BAM2_PYRGI|nr:uncharacterized protein PgNI_04448 [Pyricularia grisea]TLD12863.1 hypothetical protein PgNI_04448 [Pyricularia grisea]
MGIGAGFHMVPALGNHAKKHERWLLFISAVKKTYEENDRVRIEAKSSTFTRASTHCFRSRTTSRSIARQHFDAQIVWWDESSDQYGLYDWREVHESIKTYDDVNINRPRCEQSP